MTRAAAVAVLLVILFTMGIGASVMLYQLQRQARLKARFLSIRLTAGGAPSTADRKSLLDATALIAKIGIGIASSGLLSKKTLAGLEQTLSSTGLRGPSALGFFVGTKILLLLLMPLLALLLLQHVEVSALVRNVAVTSAALIGLLGPDWWVRRRRQSYLRSVAVGLPDALDLMVICAEAGLGFEPAITRVASEIRTAHPTVSTEFGQTASELRVVADSRLALDHLAARTGLESIKRMTSTLIQTMHYGTPLSDALRVLSSEVRQETLIRYETRAARLPVLLTMPMILFILPCIFLIVGGPAVIQVMQNYRH